MCLDCELYAAEKKGHSVSDDVIPTAVTFNYFYDLMSDCHTMRVHYSLPGQSKSTVAYKATSCALETCHVDIFELGIFEGLKDNGLHDSTIHYIMKLLGKARKQTYQDPLNWNTHFGGSHSFQYYTPKTIVLTSATVGGKDIETLARRLPGVTTKVGYPCNCPKKYADGSPRKDTLFYVIMHLNDSCGWTRERIADWIDRLHDNGVISAEFQPWDETGMAEEEADMASDTQGVVKVLTDGNVSLGPFTVAVGQAAQDIKNATDAMGEAVGNASESVQGLNLILSIPDEINDFEGVNDEDTD